MRAGIRWWLYVCGYSILVGFTCEVVGYYAFEVRSLWLIAFSLGGNIAAAIHAGAVLPPPSWRRSETEER